MPYPPLSQDDMRRRQYTALGPQPQGPAPGTGPMQPSGSQAAVAAGQQAAQRSTSMAQGVGDSEMKVAADAAQRRADSRRQASQSGDQGGLFGAGGLLSDKRAKRLEGENEDLKDELDRTEKAASDTIAKAFEPPAAPEQEEPDYLDGIQADASARVARAYGAGNGPAPVYPTVGASRGAFPPVDDQRQRVAMSNPYMSRRMPY